VATVIQPHAPPGRGRPMARSPATSPRLSAIPGGRTTSCWGWCCSCSPVASGRCSTRSNWAWVSPVTSAGHVGRLHHRFVFWVGIAHCGTLISAILYLFRSAWRTAVYRTAEAMTVFGVMTAGLFPVIHVGRLWFAYWLIPYPNQRQLWPNFKSPLVWDLFAISTYFTVSTCS